jgi:hypothetical protein
MRDDTCPLVAKILVICERVQVMAVIPVLPVTRQIIARILCRSFAHETPQCLTDPISFHKSGGFVYPIYRGLHAKM